MRITSPNLRLALENIVIPAGPVLLVGDFGLRELAQILKATKGRPVVLVDYSGTHFDSDRKEIGHVMEADYDHLIVLDFVPERDRFDLIIAADPTKGDELLTRAMNPQTLVIVERRKVTA